MKIEIYHLLGDKINRSEDRDFVDDTIDLTHEQIVAIWKILGFLEE